LARKSVDPDSQTPSTTSRACRSIASASCRRIACGVKALFTILRSEPWSGGSMFSIMRRSTATSLGRWSRRRLVPRQDEKSSGWRDT
jgi:hypothetical protein